jgi:hypothetical protein
MLGSKIVGDVRVRSVRVICRERMIKRAAEGAEALESHLTAEAQSTAEVS